MEGQTFEEAKTKLAAQIGDEAARFSFLLSSPKLTAAEKARYRQLIDADPSGRGEYSMGEAVMSSGVRTLEQLLFRHYGRGAVVLMDAYDLPLLRAEAGGYRAEMSSLLGRMLSAALGADPALALAVLTGCRQIPVGSFFDAVHSPQVNSFTSHLCREYFGFDDTEVRQLLHAAGREQSLGDVRDVCGGYLFGGQSTFCPREVMSFCWEQTKGGRTGPEKCRTDAERRELVRDFLHQTGPGTARELERLLRGGSVFVEERDLWREDRWKVLCEMGVLTGFYSEKGRGLELTIPNQKTRELFMEEIRAELLDLAAGDRLAAGRLSHALSAGEEEEITWEINRLLRRSISIPDSPSQRHTRAELFRDLLPALLRPVCEVTVGTRSAEKYTELLIRDRDTRTGIILVLTDTEGGDSERCCREAMEQVRETRSVETLLQEGMRTVRRYIIAFCQKRCRVLSAE